MITLDTSAVVAVIFGEEDADSFAASMVSSAGDVIVGAPTLLECHLVAEARQGPEAVDDLRSLLERLRVEVRDFDGLHVRTAHQAWRRFGKGRHPAALNFGDCCSYATARVAGFPLLFKGNDFRQTDIGSVR